MLDKRRPICEKKKTVGRKWSMRFEYTDDIRVPCTYPARHRLSFTERNGTRLKHENVCGVHKRQMVGRCRDLGIDLAIEELDPNA